MYGVEYIVNIFSLDGNSTLRLNGLMPPGLYGLHGGKKVAYWMPGCSLVPNILALCWVYSALRWARGFLIGLGVCVCSLWTNGFGFEFWKTDHLGCLKKVLGSLHCGSALLLMASSWSKVVTTSINWFRYRRLRPVVHVRLESWSSMKPSIFGVGFCSPILVS